MSRLGLSFIPTRHNLCDVVVETTTVVNALSERPFGFCSIATFVCYYLGYFNQQLRYSLLSIGDFLQGGWVKENNPKFKEWFSELPLENQMKFVVSVVSGIAGIFLGFCLATGTPNDFPLDPTLCIITGVIGLVLLYKADYWG